MSRQQVRPKAGGDPYSPQRDLAYCYAPAMLEALRALDSENWTDEVRWLCEHLSVHEDELSRAVGSITEAHLAFIADPAVGHADEALRNAGWYDHRIAVRYLIYSRLGEVMLGGFFLAIRDVRILGEEVPHAKEVADLIAEGLRVAGRTASLVEPDPVPSYAIQLQMARRALEEQAIIQDDLRMALHAAEKKARDADVELTVREAEVSHINSLGFWRGICRAIKAWYRGVLNPIPDAGKQN